MNSAKFKILCWMKYSTFAMFNKGMVFIIVVPMYFTGFSHKDYPKGDFGHAKKFGHHFFGSIPTIKHYRT